MLVFFFKLPFSLLGVTVAAKGYFDALVKLGELASDSQGSKELGEWARETREREKRGGRGGRRVREEHKNKLGIELIKLMRSV